MSAARVLGIALITAGVLALVYGSFSYTRETHEAKLGPLELLRQRQGDGRRPGLGRRRGDCGGRRAAAQRGKETLIL